MFFFYLLMVLSMWSSCAPNTQSYPLFSLYSL